jgi:dienelactone hydrolase
MYTETIPYNDHNKDLEGFVAYPTEKKSPMVILCHAWRGRDDFICEKAEHIATLGYVGFALDMYGKGVLGQSKEDNAALKKPFIDDRSFLRRRLLKGYQTACSLPYVDTDRVAVLGFGFGAICALDLSRSEIALKGAISIYGHFDPPQNCPVHPIKAKVLILHGYKDPVSPIDELYAFQQELDKDKTDWQSHIYGNAFHAFANPAANDPASGIMYNPVSAENAWNESVTFLTQILS